MISVSSAFDLHQQQIADVQANHGDIEERLTGLTSRLSDLRELIKDRSKLLEDIYYQRCRIEEESELLKRRLDAMARVENPTEMKLAKEREEYKVIVIAADQS
jgi:septal ring factor EnvC (AmiA/AmiB activator)